MFTRVERDSANRGRRPDHRAGTGGGRRHRTAAGTAVIVSMCRTGGTVVAPGTRGRAQMKKLLLTVIVSAAGFAVWRKVESSKTGTQPWSTATDKV